MHLQNTLLKLFGCNPDGTVYYKQDVAVDGREDFYERIKERDHKFWRDIYGNHIFFGPEFYIRTFTTNVDDYKMDSKCDSGGWYTLGHLNAEDDRDNLYKDRLYWKQRRFLLIGRLDISQYRNEFFDFKSWTDSFHDYMAGEDRYVITEWPDINDHSNRKFENHGTTYKEACKNSLNSSQLGVNRLSSNKTRCGPKRISLCSQMEKINKRRQAQ